MKIDPTPIVICQVSPGANGAGYIVITDGTNPVGYILSIGDALESPNGQDWPIPGTPVTKTEYWWFATAALQQIQAGTLTTLVLDSSDLEPANSNPSKPTLNSNPLTVIPSQFGSTPYVSWTTGQNPLFNPGGAPTTATSMFRLFKSEDGKVCIGWVYSGSSSDLSLANQFWATNQTGNNRPGFWFGPASGAPEGAIVVSGTLVSATQYPSSGSYMKKTMTLIPASIPL